MNAKTLFASKSSRAPRAVGTVYAQALDEARAKVAQNGRGGKLTKYREAFRGFDGPEIAGGDRRR